MRDVVSRYGEDGEFWGQNREVPYRPIKAWQVWNEANFAPYWNRKPDAREYVRFLKLTHDAIQSQDDDAKVVLAGLPNTKLQGPAQPGALPGPGLPRGGARYFDVAAVNLYASSPRTCSH